MKKNFYSWLNECVELRVFNTSDFMNPISGTGSFLVRSHFIFKSMVFKSIFVFVNMFQTLNPTLAQNLQSLTLDDTPVGN
jgi:hypothetical protein